MYRNTGHRRSSVVFNASSNEGGGLLDDEGRRSEGLKASDKWPTVSKDVVSRRKCWGKRADYARSITQFSPLAVLFVARQSFSDFACRSRILHGASHIPTLTSSPITRYRAAVLDARQLHRLSLDKMEDSHRPG